MSSAQQFSLKWNNYMSHITTAFGDLRDEDEFVDCTLSCEGKRIKVHKMLLSACSTYFKEIFKENPHPHPVIILKGVSYYDLSTLIDFMYNGEVKILEDQLASFLSTAEMLKVKGLSDRTEEADKPKLTRSVSNEVPILVTKTEPSTPPNKINNLVNLSLQRNDNYKPTTQSTQTDTNQTNKNFITSTVYEPKPCVVEGSEFEEVNVPAIKDETIDQDSLLLSEENDGCSSDTEMIELNDMGRDGDVVYVEETNLHVPGDGTQTREQANAVKRPYRPRVQIRRRTLYRKIDENIYECCICFKRYANHTTAGRHVAVHTGETTCSVCGKVMSNIQHLRVHQMTKHDVKFAWPPDQYNITVP